MMVLSCVTWILFVYRNDPYLDLHAGWPDCEPGARMNGVLRILEVAVALAISQSWRNAPWRWCFAASRVLRLFPGLATPPPSRPGSLPHLERLARIEVNADGERGARSRSQPTPVYRILVAGGSPVECACWINRRLAGSPSRDPRAPHHLRTLGVSRPSRHIGFFRASPRRHST